MIGFKERIPNEDLEHLAKKEEPRFLSIILRSKESLMDCVSFGIKPEYFWSEENVFLYKVILDNYKKYNSVLSRSSMDSIMDQQSSYSEEQKSARKMHWDKIYHTESDVGDYEFLKTSINARHVQQQAYDLLKDSFDKIVKSTVKQTDLVGELRKNILAIEGMDANSHTVTMSIKEGMEKALAHIDKRRAFPGQDMGIMCGIDSIDETFNGFIPGSYTVISGMPGGGKTTTMFNIAFGMAKKGASVVYVSIEKEAVPFYLRLLALHANVDYNRIKKGGTHESGIPKHIYEAFVRAKNDLARINPKFEVLQVPPGTKLSKILAEVDKIRNKQKVEVLVVDYLGVVGVETHFPTRPDLEVADVSMRLQSYGKIHKMATVTAVQLKASATKEIRKKSEKVTDKDDVAGVAVNTEDMAGSQKVIYDADNAMGVVMNKDKPPTEVYIYITKARDNEAYKTLLLNFNGRVGSITDKDVLGVSANSVADRVYSSNLGDDPNDLDSILSNEADKTSAKVETKHNTNMEPDFALEEDTSVFSEAKKEAKKIKDANNSSSEILTPVNVKDDALDLSNKAMGISEAIAIGSAKKGRKKEVKKDSGSNKPSLDGDIDFSDFE